MRLRPRWDLDPIVLGARVEGSTVGEDAPFYGLPFLNMRGVPAFRYVGRHTLVAELEPRWKVSRRWSLVGFVSAGQAVLDPGEFGSRDPIVAGGGGFRYLIARELGLAVGADVGVGPEDTAVYFIVGSAWQGL